MAGSKVSRELLDMRSSEVLVDIRRSFSKVEAISEFLANTPVVNGVDPLSDPNGIYKYNADEAYLIRLVFDSLSALAMKPILKQGRKLTWLE